MDTNVVNVKVAYIRPKYQNLKEWINGYDNIYIGRGGIVFIDGERYPKKGSIWANPYKGEGAIEKFEEYMREKLKSGKITREQLLELKGKNLGCWCKPNACHGDILIKLINES